MPNDLNIQISQRISVALVALMLMAVVLLAVHFKGLFLVPLLLVLILLLSLYWFHDWNAARPRKTLLGSILATLGAVIFLAWRSHMLSLIPPLVVSLAWICLRHRFLRASRYWRLYSALTAVLLLGTVVFLISFMPKHPIVVAPFVILLSVLLLNSHFYTFLWRRKSFLFVLAAIPFHLLYHLYNGISFVAGGLLYSGRRAGRVLDSARRHEGLDSRRL